MDANQAAGKCELSGEDGGDVCGAKIKASGMGWSVKSQTLTVLHKTSTPSLAVRSFDFFPFVFKPFLDSRSMLADEPLNAFNAFYQLRCV